jgi:D-galactonate transporter
LSTATHSPEFEKATYSKVTWHLIPFLFLCYILAYLDRVNVGFAKLQMQAEPWFSDAVFATGAGIFFIGYFFFEVPSNMILARVGAKIWIARIMIVWGIISAAMMYSSSSAGFYALRFLLGVAEAGFFPGIILYLTFWYTRTHRAKMVAAFMTAIALAGVFGNPASGWILAQLSGVHGLKGWQWLFLLEGIPSIIVGIGVLFFLDDNPKKAKWLTQAEKDLVLARLEEEQHKKASAGESHHTFADAFRNYRVWVLCLVYFGVVMGVYGVTFWLPQIIKDTITKDPWQVGLIAAIPWTCAAVGMVLIGHSSDRTGERRWHITLSALAGAAGLAISAIHGISPAIAIASLALGITGMMATVSSFWSLPTAMLSGTAAAAGIAWINSVGNLAGYLSPEMVNWVKGKAGMSAALLALSVCVLITALLVIYVTGLKPAEKQLVRPASQTG